MRVFVGGFAWLLLLFATSPHLGTSFIHPFLHHVRLNRICAASDAVFVDAAEFQTALRAAGTPAAALEMLNRPDAAAFINQETAHLLVAALIGGSSTVDRWETLESFLYLLRNTHDIATSAAMWDEIIITAAKEDPNLGKKYFNRMVKHGPVTTTLCVYEAMVKAYSKVENWKEIMSLYNTMREMDDAGAVPVLAQVGVGFYERVLSANARRGRWKEATYWMDEINRRGLAPSHKCYRLAIDACNKGGKAKEALKYIDAMLEAFADEGSIDDEAAPEGGEE